MSKLTNRNWALLLTEALVAQSQGRPKGGSTIYEIAKETRYGLSKARRVVRELINQNKIRVIDGQELDHKTGRLVRRTWYVQI